MTVHLQAQIAAVVVQFLVQLGNYGPYALSGVKGLRVIKSGPKCRRAPSRQNGEVLELSLIHI